MAKAMVEKFERDNEVFGAKTLNNQQKSTQCIGVKLYYFQLYVLILSFYSLLCCIFWTMSNIVALYSQNYHKNELDVLTTEKNNVRKKFLRFKIVHLALVS